MLDLSPSLNDDLIMEAKEYWLNNSKRLYSSLKGNSIYNSPTPLWSKAITKYNYVEIPILFNKNKIGTSYSMATVNKANDNITDRTFLVMSKSYQGFKLNIVKIIPSNDWLKNNSAKVKDLHLYNLYESEFTGMLIYKNMDGSFSSGAVLVRGRHTGQISSLGKNSSGRISSTSDYCVVIYEITYTQYCTITTSNGDINCGSWEVSDIQTIDSYCVVEYPGVRGGGGGVDENNDNIFAEVLAQDKPIERNINSVRSILQKFVCPNGQWSNQWRSVSLQDGIKTKRLSTLWGYCPGL